MQKIFLFFGFFIFLLFGARAANAATLYFSPSSGNFTVGNVFTVNVLVNTENADINNAEATVNFPSGLLEIISISKSGSIFSLWVEEPAFSNSAGTLSLNGGLPTPGFKGASGKVIGAVFRVKKAGSASLVFSSAAVRANDGYGTDVLRARTQAQFNLISEEKPLPLPPTTIEVPEAPNIKSSTHPDSNKWYSNNDPVFKWTLPSNVSEVRLVLAKKPSSIPQVSYIPPISEKALTDLENGIWYLNGQFRTSAGLGPVASFRFQIDTEAPRSFEVTRVDIDDPTNPQPELLFESSDSTSGIDHYEMKIGEGDWFTISPDLAGKPYKLPLQAPGAREITVKAFDRAGNTTTTTTTTTTIESIKPPVIESAPAKIEKGAPVDIEGSAPLRVKVVLEVLRGGGKFAAEISSASQIVGKFEGVADDNGKWEMKITGLPSGEFWARAYSLDERGAVSVFSEPVYFTVSSPLIKNVLRFLIRGFDIVLNFLVNKWLFIVAGVLIWSFIYVLIKNVFPFIGRELRKIAYICRTYGLDKKVGKRSKKLQIELKMVQNDIKKELELLEKIRKHRGFHSSEEKYIKKKLEKYLGLLKSLK